MAYARDKFWMFGVRPHQDDIWLKPSESCPAPYRFRSRITPCEGAMMLNAQNMMMINCEGEPVPYSEDAYGYAESFLKMKNVLWGGTGSGGFRIGNEEDFICRLAKEYPNIKGEYLDDVSSAFFGEDKAERTIKLLKEIRESLDKAPRKLDIYMTWYWHEELYEGMEKYIDAFTFWCWNSDEIPSIKEKFEKAEPKYKNKKILIGIYMYDFSQRKPVPVELMELQCEYALSLLKEGRIDGMIFEANSVMGVGLESEKWLRDWTERVQYTVVPD